MIGAFHCGKGASAVNSVMGFSITRHAVLILNHLLAEMQQSNINVSRMNYFLLFFDVNLPF